MNQFQCFAFFPLSLFSLPWHSWNIVIEWWTCCVKNDSLFGWCFSEDYSPSPPAGSRGTDHVQSLTKLLCSLCALMGSLRPQLVCSHCCAVEGWAPTWDLGMLPRAPPLRWILNFSLYLLSTMVGLKSPLSFSHTRLAFIASYVHIA